eukprot:730076-Rhodomonas_salina.1
MNAMRRRRVSACNAETKCRKDDDGRAQSRSEAHASEAGAVRFDSSLDADSSRVADGWGERWCMKERGADRNPQTLKSSNPQTLKPSNPQTP